MNPSIAYALFCKGLNTYDIACLKEGRTEAEVVEALMKFREMRNERSSALADGFHRVVESSSRCGG